MIHKAAILPDVQKLDTNFKHLQGSITAFEKRFQHKLDSVSKSLMAFAQDPIFSHEQAQQAASGLQQQQSGGLGTSNVIAASGAGGPQIALQPGSSPAPVSVTMTTPHYPQAGGLRIDPKRIIELETGLEEVKFENEQMRETINTLQNSMKEKVDMLSYLTQMSRKVDRGACTLP
jgi:hypothetical protein